MKAVLIIGGLAAVLLLHGCGGVSWKCPAGYFLSSNPECVPPGMHD